MGKINFNRGSVNIFDVALCRAYGYGLPSGVITDGVLSEAETIFHLTEAGAIKREFRAFTSAEYATDGALQMAERSLRRFQLEFMLQHLIGGDGVAILFGVVVAIALGVVCELGWALTLAAVLIAVVVLLGAHWLLVTLIDALLGDDASGYERSARLVMVCRIARYLIHRELASRRQ